ncbi:sugar phosphate isomerase/epimerase [Ktedonosporobacter rubrisoli]|uniref:Sugar phosphate isomerase/epimerase n=1 Tax=Ktedonosporobacter rubrisoli TaxID=2509675 RepID=A0A4P6JW62_KTERU|nr:sugar phosphate isomerase/epimerase [Ktedonosporobacter rubrisoli]QBD79794.1 sugar phosphate isomerase/epimerase [Ktedonosporobacter rubrisoli]
MSEKLVALQLYTVRDETARDFKGTIRRVASLGYPAVEFAGYGDLSAAETKDLLKETGLRGVSTHVGWSELEKNLDYHINYCLEIGCPHLVLPSLPHEWHNADSFRTLAPQMNEIGRRCQERGLSFGYHNHDFEFQQSDGQYLLDILFSATDPALVSFELDTYWAAYAGVDPIAYLRQHAGRIPLIHLKDMTADRHYTEVGDGTLDIAGICRAAQESGTRFYIVEHDAPTIPSLESARRSLENLRKLGF